MNGMARRDEGGNMLPLVVVSALVLFAVLAFAVDQGIAYAAKARQENALDDARAACMDASFALVAKNAEDPGRAIAERVARTVRDAGFDGRVAVWFYEAPEGSVPRSERFWTIGVQLDEDSPTVFARGYGIAGIPVASHRVLTAMPYAGEAVWRPATRQCGRYDVGAGVEEAGISFDALATIDEFPEEIAQAARAALSEKRNDERKERP